MSIVPMQKIRLIVFSSDRGEVLSLVQKYGAIEFIGSDSEQQSDSVKFDKNSLFSRIKAVINFIDPYYNKPGLWKSLRQGSSVEMKENDLKSFLSNSDVILKEISDIEQLQAELSETRVSIKQLEDRNNWLLQWKNLPLKLNQLETVKTKTILLQGRRSKEENKEYLLSLLDTNEISSEVLTIGDREFAVIILKNEVEKFNSLLDSEIFEAVSAQSGDYTPAEEIKKIQSELQAKKAKLSDIETKIKSFTQKNYKDLIVAHEIMSWKQGREDVLNKGQHSNYTIKLDGWINVDKRTKLESDFNKHGLAVVIQDLTPEEGEEPPVDVKNSSLVEPFELVTRLYGMPGYKDLDPTPFLSAFFILFFGMSLTDVGYGLFLAVVGTLILFAFKVSHPMRLFAKLLVYVGLATVVVGILFGGYLGFSPTFLPDWMQSWQKFDPIGEPLKVFYLSLILGVVHIAFGLMVKIYSEYRQGRLLSGIVGTGPWLLMFILGSLLLLVKFDYIKSDFLSESRIINLIYVDLVLIVLSGASQGKSWLQKIQSGASSLYDSVGYFSDILSYSRLLALGLSTTALAFAVNMIAEMVVDVPYVGFLLAGAILLVGHLFTLAVNTLGAFIHSARLQFVEFFGKFISGTGREFKPLARKYDNITIVDD